MKTIHWTDTYDIVEALEQARPDCDPLKLRFTELRQMVLDLPGFGDDPSHCNEKILEAIQMTWLDEK